MRSYPAKSMYVQALEEFHTTFGHVHSDKPNIDVDEMTRALRIRLIQEEASELFDAMLNNDMVEIADGLADLLYVTFGTAVTYGIPIDDCFLEVHHSNMSKVGDDGKPVMDEGGKQLKGPNFIPPELGIILVHYGLPQA